MLDSLRLQATEALGNTIDELRATVYVPFPNHDGDTRSVLIHLVVRVPLRKKRNLNPAGEQTTVSQRDLSAVIQQERASREYAKE